MSATSRAYVPPAGSRWALPLYDPIGWLLGADAHRAELVAQAGLRPGMRALEIGCGTGALAIRIRQGHPEVEISGIDPDPDALDRARRKAARAGVSIRLERGFADALPWPDETFDRVFSSFMLHHLEPDEKRAALLEVRRVLRPGGSLHLLDLGGPGSAGPGRFGRLLHARERLRDQLGGRVLSLLEGCGFEGAAEVAHQTTLIGPIARYRASRPG